MHLHVAGTQSAAFWSRFATEQHGIVMHGLKHRSIAFALGLRRFMHAGCVMGPPGSGIPGQGADGPVLLASPEPQTAFLSESDVRNLTMAGPMISFRRLQAQDMVAVMIGSILGRLSSAVVRGLAVVALVVVWSVGHIGTTALSVVGVSSLVLTTTATPADAYWYGRRWRRRRRWRRWRRW
jgi:hypothetical protein